jgi:hypothetical protein
VQRRHITIAAAKIRRQRYDVILQAMPAFAFIHLGKYPRWGQGKQQESEEFKQYPCAKLKEALKWCCTKSAFFGSGQLLRDSGIQ